MVDTQSRAISVKIKPNEKRFEIDESNGSEEGGSKLEIKEILALD